MKSYDKEQKDFVCKVLLRNDTAPVSKEGENFKTLITALKQKYENQLTSDEVLFPEIPHISQVIANIKKNVLTSLNALIMRNPSFFMMTALTLDDDFSKEWFKKQITPYFSVTEMDGISYFTLGDLRGVPAVKDIKNLFAWLENMGKSLKDIKLLLQLGRADEPNDQAPLPIMVKIEEEQKLISDIRDELKAVVHNGVARRNYDALEWLPFWK